MEVDLANAGAATLADGALSFGLLQVVSEARNEHGLRHHDYKAYREFCTKKVHRLRRGERITHADEKHAAAAKQSKPVAGGKKRKAAGKGRRVRQTPASQAAAAKSQGPNVFTPKVIKAESITSERPALLLLFEAERAWAHSQEYRNASFDNEEDGKLRKVGLNRLKRAAQWADELIGLLRALPEAAVDAQLVAEAVAYRTMLEGIRLFDRGNDASQEPALVQFCVARVLLNTIAEQSPTSRREALAFTFIDQGEAPLRFCAYQLGLTSDGSNLDALASQRASSEVCEQVYPGYAVVVGRLQKDNEARLQAGGQQKRTIKVEWHGRELSIRNPDLLEAVARFQSEQEHLTDMLGAAKATGGPKDAKDGKRGFVRLSHRERRAKKRNAGAASASAAATSRAGSNSRVSSSAKMDPYDRTLVALGEAEEISQQLIAENEEALAKSHTARYEAASADLRLVHDYIQYQLMSLRVARAEHLISGIQSRAERQEARAQAIMESKLAVLQGKGRPRDADAKTKRNKPKRVAATKKILKKRPNVRKQKQKAKPKSKAASKTPTKQHQRHPARSGTRALRVRQRAAEARQLRNDSLEEARRRVIQSVPGLARLYDGAEASVASIATLGLVESDPEISSLVDAKAAWYRAEMLRTIARAYALSGSYAQALLLLTRAGLFVRQARQSLSLVGIEGSDDSTAQGANQDFPPLITSDTLDAQEKEIASSTRATQREMYLGQHKVIIAGSSGAYAASRRKVAGGGGVATDASRLGTALRDLANKYVDFEDAVDLQQATVIPADVQEELDDELSRILQSARGSTAAQTVQKKPAQAAASAAAKAPAASKTQASEKAAPVKASASASSANPIKVQAAQDEAVASAEGPYDPANDDEDEDDAAAAQQSRGWFGGWFGRK
ncbi:signal recognition particle subunit srp68 [Tilletia horrida]|nr:signal recognition particle subunit srp68 [Tilletia horrida]